MDDLIDMWRAHNAINLYLLTKLPDGGLDAVPASDSMRVGRMFAHINDLRVRWLQNADADLTAQLPWFEHQPDLAIDISHLQDALERSGEAVETLIRRCAHAGTGVKDFPGPVAAFLGYLISHEAYHWGEIGLALTQSGLPLTPEDALGIWRGWWGRDTIQRQT